MTLISPVYCTVAQVERLLSATAVQDFSDHDADGTTDLDVVHDCINQATEEIDLYLRQRYTPAVLATSTLVIRWAVTMAVRFLCLRRGNVIPDSIEREWQRIADPDEGLLAQVSEGIRQLPGKAQRDDMRPTMSNVAVDRRYQRSTIRVTRQNSSDAPTHLTQDTTQQDYPQILD